MWTGNQRTREWFLIDINCSYLHEATTGMMARIILNMMHNNDNN